MANLPNKSQIDRLELEKGTKAKEVRTLKEMLAETNKHKICNDPPSSSLKYDMLLSLGDVIITATDGLFDNLFYTEILEIVNRFKQARCSEKREWTSGLIGPPCFLSHEDEARELAMRLCEAARAKVDDGDAKFSVKTPYQRLFKKTYHSVWEVSSSSIPSSISISTSPQ